MEENQKNSDLFNKYINNKCTKEEFLELMSLIKISQTTDYQTFDDSMKLNWEQAKKEQLEHDINWNKIYSTIVDKNPKLIWKRITLKYAASIAFVIAGFFIFHHENLNKNIFTKQEYLSQRTGPVVTKTVVLNDGTKITLNANSSLRYPQNFSGKTREVYLKGEAYFQVVHDTKKPFIVHSGKLKTQVLGTTFTINAYAQDQPLTVSVLTGKVAVKDQSTNALVMLSRGQSAATEKGKKFFRLSTLPVPEDAIAWLEDKLIFDSLTLGEVVRQLNNKYGVTIEIENRSLSNQRITAIFQKKTLPNILNALTRLTHTKYTRYKNTYTIY